jgi:hypothetical protein
LDPFQTIKEQTMSSTYEIEISVTISENVELNFDFPNLETSNILEHLEVVLQEMPAWIETEAGVYQTTLDGRMTVQMEVDPVYHLVRLRQKVTGAVTDRLEEKYKVAIHEVFDEAYVKSMEKTVQEMGTLKVLDREFNPTLQQNHLRLQVYLD